MFRAYFEGLKDPTARALPPVTTIDDSLTGRMDSLGASPTDKVSREFDPLFAKHAGALPVPFLRALAKRESNMNPKESKASFWGILQVGWRGKNSVIKGYNERFGTSFTKEDLLNPDINIMIASELINRIARNYRDLAKENPAMMQNMIPNFRNKEFVKLLLAGWNSGYSRAGGVQRVARFLAKKGIPVTHDAVFANAAKAGATKFLQASVPGKPGEHARIKQRWQRGVASLYFRMDDFTTKPPNGELLVVSPTPTPVTQPGKKIAPGSSSQAFVALPIVLALGTFALLASK